MMSARCSLDLHRRPKKISFQESSLVRRSCLFPCAKHSKKGPEGQALSTFYIPHTCDWLERPQSALHLQAVPVASPPRTRPRRGFFHRLPKPSTTPSLLPYQGNPHHRLDLGRCTCAHWVACFHSHLSSAQFAVLPNVACPNRGHHHAGLSDHHRHWRLADGLYRQVH